MIEYREPKILGDFRQGFLTFDQAVWLMRQSGHDDADAIVAEWQRELEWEEEHWLSNQQ